MSNIQLESILYRAFQLGDETDNDSISAFSGTPTDLLSLNSIKFRAYQPPGVVTIQFIDGYGYAPGTGDGSSGGVGDGTTVSTSATLTTSLTGANNDLTYTAVYTGSQGNDITITYIVSGINSPLVVIVNGTSIVVYVATDGSGNPISTAAEIAAAIAADPAASALVSVSNAPGDDGTGVVTAMATTPLGGGTGVVQPINYGGPATFNPFMTNGTAYIIPATPVIGMPVPQVNATAGIVAPNILIDGATQTLISGAKAIATASVAAPRFFPIQSPISNATASVQKPVVRVIVTSVAPTATASTVAPSFTRATIIVNPAASATASSVSPTNQTEPIKPVITAATASSVAPVLFAGVLIAGTPALATANGLVPSFQIRIFPPKPNGAASVVKQVIKKWGGPVLFISVVANATASVVAATPRITLTSVSSATAQGLSPRITADAHPALSTASITAPLVKVETLAVAASATTATVNITPSVVAVSVAGNASALVSDPRVKADVKPAIATASTGTPSILITAVAVFADATASTTSHILAKAKVAVAASANAVGVASTAQIDVVALSADSTASVSTVTVGKIVYDVPAAQATTAQPIHNIEIMPLSTIADATASIVAPLVASSGVTQYVPPVDATAAITTPSISIDIVSVSIAAASVSAPITSIEIGSTVSVANAEIQAPTVGVLTSITAVPAIANANLFTLSASVTIGIVEGTNATAFIVPPAIGNINTIISVAGEATANTTSLTPVIDVTSAVSNATASITAPAITLAALTIVSAVPAISTANTITLTTSTILIVPRTVEASASVASPYCGIGPTIESLRLNALSDGAILIYTFQEASGSPQDQSGNSNHITSVTGTPDYEQNGPWTGEKSIRVIGGEYFTRSTHVTTATDNFSLEVYINNSLITNDHQKILYNGNSGSNGYGIKGMNNGKFGVLIGGVSFGWDSVGTIEGQGWSHIVITRDSGTWKYYLNGSLDSSPGTTAPNTPNGTVQLGETSIEQFYGFAAIYNTALSSTQVQAHYEAQSSAIGGEGIFGADYFGET